MSTDSALWQLHRFVLFVKKVLEDTKSNLHNLEIEYQNKKSQNALKSLDEYKKLIDKNAIITTTTVTDSNLLKDMAQALLNDNKLDLVMLVSVTDKVTFVCATSTKFNAGQVVKSAAQITGGNGGGKPNLAQAGGKDASKVSEALDYVKGLL